jgi:hypothetical protein
MTITTLISLHAEGNDPSRENEKLYKTGFGTS